MDGMVVEDEEEVDYSSKYYAGQSASSASNASDSESNAQGYATTASNKARDASDSATAAAGSALSASGSATTATNANTDAQNFAVAEGAFTKVTGDDHTTQYHSAKYYAESVQGLDEQVQDAVTEANRILGETDLLFNEVSAYIAASTVDSVWDSSVTYDVGDCVMTADGSTYRCISESTGNPPSLSPGYWSPITITALETFEYDTNGDLMPKLNPAGSSYWQIDTNGDIMPV